MEKSATFGVVNGILRDTGTKLFKRIKEGMSRENRDERDPYASHSVGKDLSVGFVMGTVVYW